MGTSPHPVARAKRLLSYGAKGVTAGREATRNRQKNRVKRESAVDIELGVSIFSDESPPVSVSPTLLVLT